MRWHLLLSVVFGLSITAGRLLSQETPAAEGAEPDTPPPVSLLRESGLARFSLVLGRIEVNQVRYRKGMHQRQLCSQAPEAESLAVEARRGVPRVHYIRSSPQRRLTVDVNDRAALSIESSFPTERAIADQTAGEPLRVLVESQGRREEHQFATWVHFHAAAPELYRRHFAALVDDLLFPFHLPTLADGARHRLIDELVRGAENDAAAIRFEAMDDASLDQWVEMLGSSSRVERVEATRRLHEEGISLLPRLAKFDRGSLDAEQCGRLRMLVRQLTPRGEDHEARIAMMIRDDAGYWAAAAPLLSDRERTLVAARLDGFAKEPPVRIAESSAADVKHR